MKEKIVALDDTVRQLLEDRNGPAVTADTFTPGPAVTPTPVSAQVQGILAPIVDVSQRQ